MPYQLGARSLARLEGVDARLVAVVKRAIAICPQDFTVVEGRRTRARQAELYAQGRTRPGKIVTWTMASKHIDGLAVDLAPVVDGAVDWSEPTRFDAIARAMFEAADALATPLRWGADWDRDGKPRERGETDSPHFELLTPSPSMGGTIRLTYQAPDVDDGADRPALESEVEITPEMIEAGAEAWARWERSAPLDWVLSSIYRAMRLASASPSASPPWPSGKPPLA